MNGVISSSQSQNIELSGDVRMKEQKILYTKRAFATGSSRFVATRMAIQCVSGRILSYFSANTVNEL